MVGFYIFIYNGLEVFIETQQKNKTRAFAKKVIAELKMDETEKLIQLFLWRLEQAVCEIREMRDGRQYYDIHGRNFGGCGTFVDDGHTKIIKI